MKSHRLVQCCGLLLTVLTSSTVWAQVDLTPIESFRDLDGIKLPEVAFRDGRKEIRYSPPSDWRLNGSGSKLTLIPKNLPNVDAQVEVNSPPTLVPISDATVKTYIASAQQLVPRGVKVVDVLGSKINPLKICGHDTVAVETQYEAFGTTYRSHILYLNREREQWVFQLTAPLASYNRAFEPFRVSLYSLTGL